MPTRAQRRLPPPVLLFLVALVALAAVLVATARLPLGDTVLLPGTERAGVRQVGAAAGELSLAVDVRNGGLVPVRVQGAAAGRLGSYQVRLGRGVPGGGVPEQDRFAPFLLWPGQQRLLVLHLTSSGGAPAAQLELDRFEVATSVLGVRRDLEVVLPDTIQVR